MRARFSSKAIFFIEIFLPDGSSCFAGRAELCVKLEGQRKRVHRFDRPTVLVTKTDLTYTVTLQTSCTLPSDNRQDAVVSQPLLRQPAAETERVGRVEIETACRPWARGRRSCRVTSSRARTGRGSEPCPKVALSGASPRRARSNPISRYRWVSCVPHPVWSWSRPRCRTERHYWRLPPATARLPRHMAGPVACLDSLRSLNSRTPLLSGSRECV